MYVIKLGESAWLKEIFSKKEGADERFFALPAHTPYSCEDIDLAKQYKWLSEAFVDLYKILDYNPKLRPIIEEI